ncbi:alpha/beta fold hydrolase [Niveispirillum sp.]|uniref:alpha/beta fold hydrolase n=1 Tax=Niveispirillum sp. TaxID=1917217 RepID=UPI001B52A818|nr:alpha/beta fold hydrolase [Niveispirillum sp.]MBP7339390.1 alpha/beta fold hydrolase [Niveispirillum sp.]
MTMPPPLILLPGLLCDARLWTGLTAELEGAARPLVADLTQDDNISGMIDRVLDTAPARFALAGYSMGGIVALHLASRAPERVSHLFILNSTARPDPDHRREIRDRQVADAQAGNLSHLLRDEMLPHYFGADFVGRADLSSLVLKMGVEMGAEVFTRQMRALRDRADARPLLSAIPCPTLILAAEQDAMCPVDRHEEIAAGLPDARLSIIAGAGHMAPLERPAALAAEIRPFLTGTT